MQKYLTHNYFARWTDASVGRGVEDESLGDVADAAAVAVDDEAAVRQTRDAVTVLVKRVA